MRESTAHDRAYYNQKGRSPEKSPIRKLPSARIFSAEVSQATFYFRDRVPLRLQFVRGDEPCPDRPVPHPELRRNLPQAVSFRLQLQNPLAIYPALRAAQLFAIRSRIPNPGTYPLSDQIALKLRNRTYDCE